MKKKLALLLAVCLLLALCACGSSQSGASADSGSSDFGTTAAPAEPTVSATQSPAEAQQTPAQTEAAPSATVSEGNSNASISVIFDAAGGSGTMNAVSVKPGSEYTLPECGFTAPEGKVFLGWQEGAGTETKAAGSKLKITKDTTLKAVWIGRWAALQSEIDKAQSGAVIKLTGNVTAEAADSTLLLNKTITLDLCGYTIDRGKKGPVMEVKSSELILMDSSSGQTGKITGGSNDGAGGAIVVSDASAVLTINGGTITGNTAKTGGAIYNAGTVVLNGGAITGNTASENYGGAVFNQGKFRMSGGTISGNACAGEGGGVWSEREVVLTGGSINTNSAATNGGGVYLYYGSLQISGSPVIKDNTGKDKNTNNVYLAAGVITVNGKLDQAARIGVSSASVPASGAPVVITEKLSGNGSAGSFTSDNSAFAIGTSNTGEATLAIPSASVAFSGGDGTGKMDPVNAEIGSTYKLPECKFTAPKGKVFAGWSIGGTTYKAGDSIKISGNTTVTALWKDAPASPSPTTPSPSPSAQVSPAPPVNPSPAVSPVPSPEESAEPSPEKSAEPSPEESTEPSPEESTEPSPEESAEPSPEESAEPSPEESAEPSPEESAEPSPEESKAPATAAITFDAGGGTGKMDKTSAEIGSKYTLPECKFTAPEGKVFAGWIVGKPEPSPKPEESAAPTETPKPDIRQKDEVITIEGDTLLKAQWKDAGSKDLPSETGSVFGGGGAIAAVAAAILLIAAGAAAVVFKKKKA